MEGENFYLEILNHLHDGIYFVDPERRITFWNAAAERISGYTAEEIVGQTCQSNILSHIDQNGTPLCSLSCPLYESILDGQPRKTEVFLRHKDGQRIPVWVSTIPMRKDGATTGAIEIFTPNSPVVYDDSLIERLSNLAMNDQLTGLPNRRKIESSLKYHLLELKNFASEFCVIFMDLDNFGVFNNRYGHQMGDRLLRVITKTVMQNIRPSDLFGRWGGEEFLGIFELSRDGEAETIAEKLRMLIEKSEVAWNQERLSVTASFGATAARRDDTPDSLVERADQLMYRSKRQGKNRTSSDGA